MNRLPALCAIPAALGLLPARAAPKRPADVMRIHIVDVGQGDCTIIESPADERGDRKVMMIDAGESKKLGNEGQHTVEPYLRQALDDGPPARPMLRLDYLLLSHYHLDHMGSPNGAESSGLFFLVEALNIQVGQLLDPGLDFDASGQGDLTWKRWVTDNRIPRETLRFDQQGSDRQIDMGPEIWVEPLAIAAQVEGRGRVIKDDWLKTSSQNDFSNTLVVHFGRFDFLVGGDLSGYLHEGWGNWYHSIEAAMFPHLRPVEVYRVNHHGSQWSSSYAFMQRIQPIASLISCGEGHKHPNEYAVQRILGFEDFWTGRPLGSDIFQTRNIDGYLIDGPHPHTEKVQHVANGPIVVETDGVSGFTVFQPGKDPITYPLHDDPAFTTPPHSVLEARRLAAEDAGKLEEWTARWGRLYDVDDVKAGLVVAPKSADMQGAD